MLQRLTPDQTLAIIIVKHLLPLGESLFKIHNVLMEIMLVPRHTHNVPSQPVCCGSRTSIFWGGKFSSFVFPFQGTRDFLMYRPTASTLSFLWGMCVEKVTETGMYF